MILTFLVRNQTISYIDTKVTPRIGSSNYLQLKFNFVTKDWNSLRKTLHISAGEYSEPFILESNIFDVPPYCTQQESFKITLLGDNESEGTVVPTNALVVSLDESNNLWTAEPPDPQNSAYLQLIGSVGDLGDLKTSSKSNLVDAINSLVDGGFAIELDTTLSEAGKAADAKAVGDALANKQNTISDLETIRSGAAKGATALQTVPSTYRTALAQDVIDSDLNDRIEVIEGKEASWNGKYSKPVDGIPKTDLESAVQTSLDKADSALQSVPSTYRTASEQDTIDSGKVDKVTGKGLSSNDYTDAAKAKVDSLASVATSGSYNDLTNKPTIPTAYDDTEVRERIGAIEAKESTWDAKSNFSGNYNDLTDKPTIPAPVTEQTVSGWGFTKNTGTYSKPTGGIPKTDLANDVQASLNKAETALQEHQSLAAYRTAEAQNLIDNSKQDKLIAGENITIAADGKTISATGGGVQSDWHQNDSTAADYVKNRPFYTGNPVETVLVEESTVSFADAGGLYQGQFLTTFEATVGETYAVNWDGTEYECVCSVFNSVPVLGNLSIAGAGSDTGEPFVMLVSNGKGLQIFTLDTSASHTFSISGFIAQNVQIPDKYISDTFRDVIIAGNPLKWSATDWTKYYDLFQGGKLLKINSYIGSDFEGYVLSMFYAAGVGSQISVITPTGGFFKLSSNSTTNELYWAPVFDCNMLYFGYLQTGSDPSTFNREEYKRLEISDGGLTFTTKTSAENLVKRKVVLKGDNVSAFTNDAGYLTLATLPKYEGETQ